MLTMSVTLSPLRPQDPDPMATDASPTAVNMTPTVEQEEGEEALRDLDSERQYGKPPPLHTGADWKIVLHLPEIETWLRMTSERVRDLTYSVQQDADSKHVDAHLVQLKDICEDISDHVEQIHALLETEFSLKLLSYSVNVIVDIHAVQLLWHQLRVSVLVLRERILQGLQDANGNYTRQTDILQAFSEETKEGRLDSLTEVDDSGQLTIKCSQNYLSLDCGITAFELSDYSPSEDLLGDLGDATSSQGKTKPFDSWSYSEMEEEFPELIRSVGLLTVAADPVPSGREALKEDSSQMSLSEEGKGGGQQDDASAAEGQPGSAPGTRSSGDVLADARSSSETEKQDSNSCPQLGAKNHRPLPCENTTPKRSIRECFHYNEDSPTQPTLPKRGLFLKEAACKNGRTGSRGEKQTVDLNPELSRSTPALADAPDRARLCLALQPPSSGPAAASRSYECLHEVGVGGPENAVKSHSEEASRSLGRLTDCREGKPRLKRPRVGSEEPGPCRTPNRGPGSGKRAESAGSSVRPVPATTGPGTVSAPASSAPASPAPASPAPASSAPASSAPASSASASSPPASSASASSAPASSASASSASASPAPASSASASSAPASSASASPAPASSASASSAPASSASASPASVSSASASSASASSAPASPAPASPAPASPAPASPAPASSAPASSASASSASASPAPASSASASPAPASSASASSAPSSSASASPAGRRGQTGQDGQGPARPDPSCSPSFTDDGESSVGSADTAALVPLLPNHERKGGYSAPSRVTRTGQVVEAWYGSDEYLALPSQLKQTEVLALKLENLTKLLPQRPRGETIQNIDDWELSEMNSDSEIYPTTYHVRKKRTRLGRASPSSSSDIASSLGESVESGPPSDILSDEELCMPPSGTRKYIDEKSERPSSSENERHSATKAALIRKLMQDIQHQEDYEAIWEKIEGFVNKLDEFIQWLKEAMVTTENWTPPKAETDSLKLYLETHLSFKLNVDSHCALKEAVEEEGHQLLQLIASHKAGLKDTLKMVASQWQALQRQIKQQHSWILRALDTIKAEILATDVPVEEEEGTGSPKAETQLCYLEAQRDAVEQMSLKLYSEQYSSGSRRKEEFADMSKVHSVGSNGLLDFDSEYQELWDWLIDMESLVMDSHDLMMSEEQQKHLYKRYSVELSIRHPKKTELLRKVEALRRGGVPLPNELLEKVDSINEKWELLGKTLRENIQDTMAGHSGSDPRDLLSPESGSLVRQLEVRIKELKGWLRDTELFIFNSCLRQEKEGTVNSEKQLQYFKSLCREIKQRQRGVASILRLCQHLLDDRDTCNLSADHQPMQLIIVNLERRWEAIVMQAVQWQTRLQKKMGKESETLNVIDPGLMDLNGMGEDALEWDETDIRNKLISVTEESSDPDQDPHTPSLKLEETYRENPGYEEEAGDHWGSQYTSDITAPSSPHIYQVYSLHNVQLSEESHVPFLKNNPKFAGAAQHSVLTKSLSKDSSFSSTKSLPDLLGSSSLVKPCPGSSGDVSQNSGSDSGIISEGGSEMPTNSETSLFTVVDGSPSNPETEHLDLPRGDAANVLQQQLKDEEQCVKLPNRCQSSISPVGCVNGKAGDLNSVTKHTTDCVAEELQEKHDVFTFYDYSYLQGSKLKFPTIMKQSQSEKVHVENPLLPGFYFDKKSCKSKHQASELQPDAPPHERILASAPHEMGLSSYKGSEAEKAFPGIQNARRLSLLSRSSSVESLSPGGDLFRLGIFKNGSDSLQRSTSLESWLTSYKSNEDLFSCQSSGDLSVSSGSLGQLSKRTLDLLNRLENIRSPSEQKIKRSVSDVTLQSSSQKMSLAGQMSLDRASSVNEDSAASLTELSSSDELSLCSEDIVLHKSKVPASNASFRKRLSQSVADESDVNVSMIVNVSCTSACTDDDDDSDLLSSSTLTLTEEELGLRGEDDDSSIATDEDIYEDGGPVSGLDYIRKELQTWMGPRFSPTREKRRRDVTEDARGGGRTGPPGSLGVEAPLGGSGERLSETNGNGRSPSRTRGLATKGGGERTVCGAGDDPRVADVENGNVESTPGGRAHGSAAPDGPAPHAGLAEDQLGPSKVTVGGSEGPGVAARERGPADGTRPPEVGPRAPRPEDPSAHCAPVQNNRPELTTETGVNSRPDGDDALGPAGKPAGCCLLEAEQSASDSGSSSCCNCEPGVPHQEDTEDCSVHDFVKEIIDMASTALKSKSQPENEVAAPTSLTQIKEKVLEHSHRPIQLRKGDFYSYLSLSSHDSDCGEVTNHMDEKSSPPSPPDTVDSGLDEKEDIECFFEACVEDDPQGEKACFSSDLPQESAVPDEAPVSLPVTASSPMLRGVSPSAHDAEVVAPSGPPHQKGPEVGKEADDVSQTSHGCADVSEHGTSSRLGREEGSSSHTGESGKPEENNAASARWKAQALSLNAGQPKGKAVLCPRPQTLTCKEKLVNFHEDRHRNMHR